MGPGPRRTKRWERRRAEILAVAEEVFAERGFAGVPLEEVADRIDMQRPSLLYYFPDKEALYDATFAGILDALLDRIERTREEPGPLERMEAIATTWIDFVSERPHAARILLRQMVDELPTRSIDTNARVAAMLMSIQEAIGEGVLQGLFKPLDAAKYAVTLAGASLVWVAARHVVRRSLGFDPLGGEHLEDYRAMLVRLTRQVLEAPCPDE